MLDAEVAVIGLGAWGSSALWRLAVRGVKVLGFEAFTIAHPFGSSHGSTRMFRVACHEHPGLVDVARLAAQLWQELGDARGDTFLHQTGAVMIGPENGRAVGRAKKAADRAGLSYEIYDREETMRRFPAHASLGADYVSLWDPLAGYVTVEPTLSSLVAEACDLGAQVFENSRIESIIPDGDAVIISTATSRFRVGQVVVATGAWLSRMQDFVELRAFRAPMFWWRAESDSQALRLENFPAFIRHYDHEHTLWGHGSTDTTAVKIGMSHLARTRPPIDPRNISRSMFPQDDWAPLSEVLTWAVPAVANTPVEALPCMTTHTPDEQFLVGRTPGVERVVLAGGCSGHGFKHASAIGEIIARTVVGENPQLDTSFMEPKRFA